MNGDHSPGPEPPGDPQDPQDPGGGSPASLALVASVVYGLLVVIAVVWLALRDRSRVLPEMALGEFGALASLGIGAAVGLGLSGVIAVLVRYQPGFAQLEARLQGPVGSLSEPEIILVAMASAIGEEMLFRCALQDVAGPYLSALIFGLLHSGPRLLLWGVSAAILGLCFSLMVEAGCGLLSVTVAHALINFLSLRRMALA